jgi:NADPH-dependent 2,4-dienoyl-CoA reductase/sulfur reductase-like enzyme/nitrite reductase/ring-hydroxylating ferredoxin subunit
VSAEAAAPAGPDLARGVAVSAIPDGSMLLGHVGDEAVLLARRGEDLFAVGATCTHYGGPLADGLMVGETVRCPWHHACFSLRTGEALRAPALNPVARWQVERRGDRAVVTRKVPATEPAEPAGPRGAASAAPWTVVIVGGGAAGDAAAEMLRREGHRGPITLVSADDAPPYDRPNLSKDYLAGTAPEEWIPLRPPGFYEKNGIELLLGTRVTDIDSAGRRVTLDGGGSRPFDALLVATGAEPNRLPAGVDPGGRVRTLRSLADSRAIIAAAAGASRAVVLGASFIGLEVAASLRARGLEVHVAAPEDRPLERVMGPGLGDFIRGLHERHGVVFHMGRKARSIDADAVTLDDGGRILADVVVAGIGVQPNVALAERAGLTVDRGILVNEFLETAVPGIFAAGDVARWPDPHTGAPIRVEHWVVAQRQGQTAARNILGRRDRFDAVPFFWSRHYDESISYVGHAERWDGIELAGDPAAGRTVVCFRSNGRTAAVATVGRDRVSLLAEAAMERGDARALAAAVA